MKQTIWKLGAVLFLGAAALCLNAEETKAATEKASPACEKQCAPCTCTTCSCAGCAEAAKETAKEKCCEKKETCCTTKECGAAEKSCACAKESEKKSDT